MSIADHDRQTNVYLPSEVKGHPIAQQFRQLLRAVVADQQDPKSNVAEAMNIEFGISCTAAVMRAAHEQALKDNHTMNSQGSAPVAMHENEVRPISGGPTGSGSEPDVGEDQAFIR